MVKRTRTKRTNRKNRKTKREGGGPTEGEITRQNHIIRNIAQMDKNVSDLLTQISTQITNLTEIIAKDKTT